MFQAFFPGSGSQCTHDSINAEAGQQNNVIKELGQGWYGLMQGRAAHCSLGMFSNPAA